MIKDLLKKQRELCAIEYANRSIDEGIYSTKAHSLILNAPEPPLPEVKGWKEKLKQKFLNEFDCYTSILKPDGSWNDDVPAMSQDKFIEVVENLAAHQAPAPIVDGGEVEDFDKWATEEAINYSEGWGENDDALSFKAGALAAKRKLEAAPIVPVKECYVPVENESDATHMVSNVNDNILVKKVLVTDCF